MGRSFAYKECFPPHLNVGYKTLIYDCITGDAALFQRADMVEAGWRWNLMDCATLSRNGLFTLNFPSGRETSWPLEAVATISFNSSQ